MGGMKRGDTVLGTEPAGLRAGWHGGLRFGLIMLGVSVLLLGLGFLVAPDSNLLGGLGPLSWIAGAIGLVAILVSVGIGLAEWLVRRRRRARPPR